MDESKTTSEYRFNKNNNGEVESLLHEFDLRFDTVDRQLDVVMKEFLLDKNIITPDKENLRLYKKMIEEYMSPRTSDMKSSKRRLLTVDEEEANVLSPIRKMRDITNNVNCSSVGSRNKRTRTSYTSCDNRPSSSSSVGSLGDCITSKKTLRKSQSLQSIPTLSSPSAKRVMEIKNTKEMNEIVARKNNGNSTCNVQNMSFDQYDAFIDHIENIELLVQNNEDEDEVSLGVLSAMSSVEEDGAETGSSEKVTVLWSEVEPAFNTSSCVTVVHRTGNNDDHSSSQMAVEVIHHDTETTYYDESESDVEQENQVLRKERDCALATIRTLQEELELSKRMIAENGNFNTNNMMMIDSESPSSSSLTISPSPHKNEISKHTTSTPVQPILFMVLSFFCTFIVFVFSSVNFLLVCLFLLSFIIMIIVGMCSLLFSSFLLPSSQRIQANDNEDEDEDEKPKDGFWKTLLHEKCSQEFVGRTIDLCSTASQLVKINSEQCLQYVPRLDATTSRENTDSNHNKFGFGFLSSLRSRILGKTSDK